LRKRKAGLPGNKQPRRFDASDRWADQRIVRAWSQGGESECQRRVVVAKQEALKLNRHGPFGLKLLRSPYAVAAKPRRRSSKSAAPATCQCYKPSGSTPDRYLRPTGLLRDFFATTRPGAREQPKKSKARDQVLALRKRNYSIYAISRVLKEQGIILSATAVREIWRREFAQCSRCRTLRALSCSDPLYGR
jgi:hypothetical protein